MTSILENEEVTELWSWHQEKVDAISSMIEKIIPMVQTWGGSNLPFQLRDSMSKLEQMKLEMEKNHKYFPEKLLERYNLLLSLIKLK